MNRTGTYVAFDGQGSTDPTESDIHYFNLLKAWNKSGSIDFRFTNSHEKTYQVRDSSSKATLFNRLETRLSASKNFLLIISDKTNYDRGILNWEIEKAVDYYELPIIIAYPGYSKIGAPSELNSMWTKSLAERIKNERAHCIHIPLKKNRYLTRLISFLLLIQSILREALWGVTQRKRIKAGVLFSNVKTSFGLYAILGTIWVQQLCNHINKIQNRIKMMRF